MRPSTGLIRAVQNTTPVDPDVVARGTTVPEPVPLHPDGPHLPYSHVQACVLCNLSCIQCEIDIVMNVFCFGACLLVHHHSMFGCMSAGALS